MSYPYLSIPKLECEFNEFTPAAPGEEPNKNIKTTRDELRKICKEHGISTHGLKFQLEKRLKEAGAYPEGVEHPFGPRWFYFDEAFGSGKHSVYFLCICGCIQCLDDNDIGYKFTIRKCGTIRPSLVCGNDECIFHIWAHLDDWDGYGKHEPRPQERYNRVRPFDFEEDKRFSKLYNRRYYG